MFNTFKNVFRSTDRSGGDSRKQLLLQAKEVLDKNWTGSFTKPSSDQYPYQWSWDSAFIAIGYAHVDQQKAEQEIKHLFRGQWENGMVPHIVFHSNESEGNYFPGPEFWQTDRSPHAPEEPNTSGICQPPVHATAVRHILRCAGDKSRALHFASEMYPKLKAWHEFLYRERDPFDEGLVYIRHPWSSGQDNSPIWDPIFEQFPKIAGNLPHYERKDTRHVETSVRPSDEDYDRYVYLVDFFRKRNYDEERIREDGCPFLVQDVLFNTLLCRAGSDLAAIARVTGHDPAPFEAQADKTARAMNQKLWDKEHGTYIDFDIQTDKQIHAHVLSGFLPLFAEIPDSGKAERIFNYLNTSCFCRLDDYCIAAPSYDRSGEGYSSSKYWRGPIWINMNWLLCEGLMNYGYDEYAKKINRSIIQLPYMSGFREYYDPDTGEGYGTDNFSWTASLLLDIAHRDPEINIM